MRRSSLVVLLALAIVLAGCSGITPGGDETPARTVTPAPVPTDEPTPTPVPQLAPGLTGKGVMDAFALGDAHAAVLENTSYTVHTNSTIRYANGTVFNQVMTRAQYAANNSRFYIVQNGLGVNVRGSGGFSIWSNGERVLSAETSNNSTSYNAPGDAGRESTSPQQLGFALTNREQIYAFFGAVETRVTDRTTRNGTTLYRVEATNVTTPTAFERQGQNPRNVTLVAHVDSAGLVHEYRLNYTATLNDSTVRVHRHVRYTDLGNTTVDRPPWYDEAIENVSTATPTAG